MGERIAKGDYVLATKYDDGDPADPWCVGWYDSAFDHFGQTRHLVVDDDGKQFKANGYRRVGVITAEQGEWLVTNSTVLETLTAGLNLWEILPTLDVEPE